MILAVLLSLVGCVTTGAPSYGPSTGDGEDEESISLLVKNERFSEIRVSVDNQTRRVRSYGEKCIVIWSTSPQVVYIEETVGGNQQTSFQLRPEYGLHLVLELGRSSNLNADILLLPNPDGLCKR